MYRYLDSLRSLDMTVIKLSLDMTVIKLSLDMTIIKLSLDMTVIKLSLDMTPIRTFTLVISTDRREWRNLSIKEPLQH